MSVLKTGFRAASTCVVVWLLVSTAFGQSVLNFPARELTSLSITNTTAYSADVKLTLYSGDGSQVTAGVLNPVSHRIPPREQLSLTPSQIFRMSSGARQDSWIQATSSVSGLEGFFFAGGFLTPFAAGGEAVEPQTVQTVPLVAARTTSLLITNPSSQTTNYTVSFFNAVGTDVGTRPSTTLAARAQVVVTVPPRAVSARVIADTGVLASAPTVGQGAKAQGMTLVAPYFKNGENTRSELVLNNPTPADVLVGVTFFTNAGSQQSVDEFILKANASAPLSFAPTGEGWLYVEARAPVSGLVRVSSGESRATLPLQLAPSDRVFFSRALDDSLLNSTLSLVGTSERALVTVAFNRPDGTTIAKRDVELSPMFRRSEKLSDLLLLPDGFAEGYVTVQSSAPIYSAQIIQGEDGAAIAGLEPQNLAAGFQPAAVQAVPRITVQSIPAGADGIRRISISGQNIDSNSTLYIGGRIVPLIAAGGGYTADFPDIEWGYVNVKVRTGGVDSNIVSVPFFPTDTPFTQRTGRAFYQKIEVADTGLDPSRTVLVPIRHARVEVFDPFLGVVSVSETDEEGAFRVGVPENRGGLTIRVLSRFRWNDVKVLDNTSGNRPYILARDLDQSDTDLQLVDTSRQSGAFNILDNIHRGNALIGVADPPPITIYWSERNNEQLLARLSGGQFRTTFFNLATNTAYILGDRNLDSDEFDDSVILHEYAHMLASRFSRDDTPGGPHVIGDILDPRLAWSEGWANFFSSVARGTSLYLDSKGVGIPSSRYDLEDDAPANDRPGYWSEASVHGLLWDLFDDNQDGVDTIQLPFSSIWAAFTDLRNVRYVYLPFFLESVLARNPGFSDSLRAMVIRRSIDFQPDVRPSVVNPFPRPITVGETRVDNNVDSYTSKRTNLANSSHFWSFSTTGGVATISLNIDGLGPANNPNANDLDLFLYDGNGRRLEIADQALNGQAEMIAGVRLAPGNYYVEVRSYYRSETNVMVFNSGRYRLSVQIR